MLSPASAGRVLLEAAASAILCIVAWVAWVVFTRLVRSPLAKFPGPKLAAATGAYEGYFDCIKDGGGRYWLEINRMHDQYGPIVRISPWELHIRDPDWNDVYKITRRTSKPMWYYRFLGHTGNAFTTESADTHRARREALQPYFSPAAVARHQPEVERLVGKLLERLGEFKGKDAVVDIGDAFRCLATDVATAFAFRSPFGHLDKHDFEHQGNTAVRSFGHLGLWNRQMNGLAMALLGSLPPWLARRLNPAALGVQDFYKSLGVVIVRELGTGSHKAAQAQGSDDAEANIIHQIQRSKLPAAEKAPARIMRECASVTLAGTETTGSFLSVAAFLLLNNPSKLEMLRAELKTAEEGLVRKLQYQELRDLPYLTGVINETFRLNTGVSGRLPRYDPKQDMRYGDWIIPKGTVVSTTQNDSHFSAAIFPQPSEFLPERWVDAEERKRLSKYLAPFGRGTRSCIGMEIATVEIYITLARLFAEDSGLALELFDTDYEQDVAIYHDYFSPFPKTTKGVRAFVR